MGILIRIQPIGAAHARVAGGISRPSVILFKRPFRERSAVCVLSDRDSVVR